MAELLHPDIAGNYLSGLRNAQAAQLQQQQAQRQGVVAQQQDTQFEQGQQDRQTAQANQQREQLIAALRTVKTPEDFAKVQQFAVTSLGIPQDKVMRYRFEDLPALLQTSAQAPQYAEMERERLVQDRSFGLQQQQLGETRRHNMATEARTALGGKAPPGFMWSPDGTSLVPIPGGPRDPSMKLTEGQSKDLGYYQRGSAANQLLTDARVEDFISGGNSIARDLGSLPVIGPTLKNNPFTGQSPQSRQAEQASRDFIAAILRKDTGAAVTPQEFEYYSGIFLPAWGDDADTIRQKAESRRQAMESIRTGLGGAQQLATNPSTPPTEVNSLGASPLVSTKAQYDQLPSGTIYREPDGQVYRKP